MTSKPEPSRNLFAATAPARAAGPAGPAELPCHCWVLSLPPANAPRPGLLAEWTRRDAPGQEGRPGAARWWGRVTYGVYDSTSGVVLVEAWVPAERLRPAGPET